VQRRRAATLGRLAENYARVLPKRPKLRGAGLPTPDYVADEFAQVRLALADSEDTPAAALTPGAAHYLTPGQLARLWHAAERLGEPVWRDLVRFLIAVPCRRGEAARLERSHLDLAAAQCRQPGRLTKNGAPTGCIYIH
jgi:integrase